MAIFHSTLPCPGYSIWNAWNGGWIPWNGDGLHGMGDGFHTSSMEWWMDSMDFPDGFHTFSMEWGMDSILFQDGFHAFLRWNRGWTPYFFHGMGDGFHIFFFTFFMSPVLDPYRMSSFLKQSITIY